MTDPTTAELAAEAEGYKADYFKACATIAKMHAAATGYDDRGPERGVIEDVADVRARMLAAEQRAERAEVALDRVRDGLNSAYRTMVHDSRDWAATKRDAWLYAILVGWTCEDHHAHNDLCMGDEPLIQTARAYGWDDATVARLRSYRAAVAALGVDGSGQPVSTAETPIILPADQTTEK